MEGVARDQKEKRKKKKEKRKEEKVMIRASRERRGTKRAPLTPRGINNPTNTVFVRNDRQSRDKARGDNSRSAPT